MRSRIAATLIALLQQANTATVRQIAAAVDPRAPWDAQVRQAIQAWIAVAQSDLALTPSWIRDLPSLGSDARHLQREWLEAFVALIQNLSDTPRSCVPLALPRRRASSPSC